jgi:hypothetical protein
MRCWRAEGATIIVNNVQHAHCVVNLLHHGPHVQLLGMFTAATAVGTIQSKLVEQLHTAVSVPVSQQTAPAWKLSDFLFGLIVSVMDMGWWAGGGLARCLLMILSPSWAVEGLPA